MNKIILIALVSVFGIVGEMDYSVAKVETDNQYSETSMTDYTCVNDCTSRGYSWGYCNSICSY